MKTSFGASRMGVFAALAFVACSSSSSHVGNSQGGDSAGGASSDESTGGDPAGGFGGTEPSSTGGDTTAPTTGAQSSDPAMGGAPSSGGSSAAGGALASGGASAVGGSSATGSTLVTGGVAAAGGTSATAGNPATGGSSTVLIDPPPELVWTKENNNGPFAGIWGSGPDDIYAGGINGNMIHWNGTKWSVQDTKPLAGQHITGVWGSGANDIYASVNANTLYHSTGDGTWTHLLMPTGSSFSDIWGTSANNIYLAGGVLWHLTGSTWSKESIGDSYGINKLWVTGDTEVWAESYYGTVTHYTGSKQWTGQVVGGSYGKYTTESFYDVWASGPNDVYVVGDQTIMHSHGDKVWVNEFPAEIAPDYVISVWGFDAHTVYASTGNGRVLRSGGDGRWFSQMVDSDGSSSSFPGLWGTSPSNMYVSQNFAIYHGVRP